MSEKQEIIKTGRKMLKPDWRNFEVGQCDGNKGVKPLPLQKPFPIKSKIIKLIKFGETSCGNEPLPKVIASRKSTRNYSDEYLSLEELSYLLWTTQGLREEADEEGWGYYQKVVPSAGGIHPFETYLYIDRVDGIAKGLYRYLPKEQGIIKVSAAEDSAVKLNKAMLKQLFGAAVVFLWSATPYKMEWGYMEVAHKMIAIEAGHICQNLQLSAESINCGSCAISAYYQDEIDNLLGLDGEDEFVIYIATVGKYNIENN